MIYPAEADIVSFLKSLLQALKPYAQANDAHITFSSVIKKKVVNYQPFLLSQAVVQIVCCIINLLPPKSNIEVRLLCNDDEKVLVIEIENNNISLIRVIEGCTQPMYPLSGFPLTNGTIYRLQVPMQQELHILNNPAYLITPCKAIPQFYKEVQKRFHSHFTQTEKLMATLEKSQPQEAAFMQKINALIKVNLEDENFDTIALCKAMSISRTQLFRQVKSLIKEAPANHIKSMRLQKAKELLESTDCTVSQVAFKTGFQTISHFTKVFKKQYGVVPSAYRQNNGHATNE